MGFESTLAIIKKTPFFEEFEAIRKAQSHDLITKEHRIPLINSLVDLSELFETFGKESGFYNIACIDLALEFYYYQLYSLESRIQNHSVIISDLEINRLSGKNSQDSQRTSLMEKLANFSITGNGAANSNAIRMNLSKELISEYTKPQLKYFNDSINALWAYKLELLTKFPDRKITFNRDAFFKLLKINYPDKIDAQGNAITNQFLNYIDNAQNEHEGATDSLLEFEQRIIENTSIITIGERVEFNKSMMEHRVSLSVDCVLNLKDPLAAPSKDIQVKIVEMNSKHKSHYKDYAVLASTELTKINDQIDIQHPKGYGLSARTENLAVNLFSKDRTPKTRAVKSLKNLREYSDNLFINSFETEFMYESKSGIQTGLNSLINSLQNDMRNMPALCQSDIIPQYVDYIKAHISYSLGKAKDITVENLNEKRKAIVTHKDYHLISKMTVQKTDHILKFALIAGLTIAIIATVTLLSLSLAPSTAHAMALSAAALASHASGYVRMAMAAVVAPAILGGCATAALMRFPSKQPPMPHDNLVSLAKDAKMNRFVV